MHLKAKLVQLYGQQVYKSLEISDLNQISWSSKG